MNNELLPFDDSMVLGRRGLFRLGGLTAATALIAAACGTTEAGPVGRIGVGAGVPKLADAVVNDGVLLRTMAGIETSIANAYTHILEKGYLTGSSPTLPALGDLSALVKSFHDHHINSAERFNTLAVDAGETAWECGNSRLDSAYLAVIFDRVENGVAATDATKAIEPSDDPTRDMANLVFTLESMSASSSQALVQQLHVPPARAEAMQLGIRSGRHASVIALRIHPGGYVPGALSAAATAETTTTAGQDGAAPPPTPIPLPDAVPGQFGLLSPTIFIGGAGDENGVRLKLNFETPSLNSLSYPFDVCPEG